jgi:hypothetical protein
MASGYAFKCDNCKKIELNNRMIEILNRQLPDGWYRLSSTRSYKNYDLCSPHCVDLIIRMQLV